MFNSKKSPTRCNNFPVYYPDVYLQLNMFRAFSRLSSGAHDCSSSLWYYIRMVVTAVLCSWSGRHLVGDLFELYDDARTYKS